MTDGAAASDPGGLASLFGSCLSLTPATGDVARLRAELEARWEPFVAFAEDLRLAPLLAERLIKRNLEPPGRAPALAAAIAANLARRRIMTERLDELVGAFNGAGMEPILLKGAVSLWNGMPGWRTLRDIDLLVPPPDTTRAQALALRLGYTIMPGPPRRARSRHHLPELERVDMPGWIEIHADAGNYNAEPFLGAAEIARASPPSARPGRGRVRLPPPHLVLLHALIHHHVGHSGDRHGTLDLKGLYEFAAGIADLEDGERRLLLRRARQHPRLVAALDLWLAAASDLFVLPIEAPFAFEPLALDRWRRIRARAEGRIPATRYPGYREEIRLAFRGIRRDAARGPLRRAAARVAVVRSLLPKLY